MRIESRPWAFQRATNKGHASPRPNVPKIRFRYPDLTFFA